MNLYGEVNSDWIINKLHKKGGRILLLTLRVSMTKRGCRVNVDETEKIDTSICQYTVLNTTGVFITRQEINYDGYLSF